MKLISFAMSLLLCVMALTAEETYMYNYKSLVSDFAFDDVTALHIPLWMIKENNLSTTNIVPILYKIDSEITSGNFMNEFDVAEYNQDRVIAVTYKWFADLVHTREITDKIKTKYESYEIDDFSKHDYIYSMLATLEGDEFYEFINDILCSSEYSSLFKCSVIVNCRHITQLYPHKAQNVTNVIINSLEKGIRTTDYWLIEKSVSLVFTNYTYSSKRKEILNNAIDILKQCSGKEKDILHLEKDLTEINKKEHSEWWRKNRPYYISFGVFLLPYVF